MPAGLIGHFVTAPAAQYQSRFRKPWLKKYIYIGGGVENLGVYFYFSGLDMVTDQRGVIGQSRSGAPYVLHGVQNTRAP